MFFKEGLSWLPDDAPVLIVLGQSNSYGQGTLLPVAEQILSPGLSNVFTLSQSEVYSTSFTSINWRGLTTLGDANIAAPAGSSEGNQNHPVNVANRFAALWQDHINSGNDLSLPDLYVILMGWSAQGMYAGAAENRWYPYRNATDVESLYPRAERTLPMAIDALRSAGKNPRILAVHWNQWEAEALSIQAANACLVNFSRIISGINTSLNSGIIPWRFFYPVSQIYDPMNTAQVIQSLEAVVAANPTQRTFIDVRNAPNYTGIAPNFGVFVSDNVHYTAQTQQWFAETEWSNITAGYRGVLL